MLLQTNSYIVPRDKRADHARLMAKFRQMFLRLGSELEVFEQTGPGFSGDGGGRFVQLMRFRDRQHQQQIHAAEKDDPTAQKLIADFCRLVNLPYQQQHGLFAAGYYVGVFGDRAAPRDGEAGEAGEGQPALAPAPVEADDDMRPGPSPGHEDADEAAFSDHREDRDYRPPGDPA